MNELMAVCGECFSEGHLSIPVYVEYPEAAQEMGLVAAAQWECSRCGKVTGIMLDGGTLDLGLVRDEQFKSGVFHEIKVFDEPPPE